ncbi:MAG: hypothetical protein K2X43_24860 [Hyphomonadaceae bacterium]|nr:hypothetical protein [Hyphomonadaceae bacterium]
MSKCKAEQDARAIRELSLEKYDVSGRLVRVKLSSAKSDLELRRNQIGQQLLDMKEATQRIESMARNVHRAEELTVPGKKELDKRAKAVADKLLDYNAVRGYNLDVSFKTLAEDYIDNQVYFHAAQQAFLRVEKAIREQKH